MILIGSTYFFKDYEGFKPKDRDYIQFTDKGIGFNFIRQVTMHSMCKFTMVRRPKEEIIEYSLDKAPAMALGKFLVPEFNNEIGFTIEDLETLRPLRDKLDAAHQYEAIIFDAYLENGAFILSDEQRDAAYESYKAARIETKQEAKHRRHELQDPS